MTRRRVTAWLVLPLLACLAADAGAQPAGTLAGRVARARAGEVIELPPGVYRPGTLRFRHGGEPGRPIVLRAAEPGTVVIRGSREVRSWQRLPGDAPVYRHAGWRFYFPPRDPPGNSSTSDARQLPRNQIFVDGEPLAEVVRRDDLRPGAFFIDPAADTIDAWLPDGGDPNARLVEAADTEGPLLTTDGHSHIRIEGLVFEHGANLPQDHALVQLAGGSDCELIDCEVRFAAGAGVSVRGENHLVRGGRFNRNGQLGLHSSRAVNCVVEDVELASNNTHPGKRFDPGWEAGGCKISRSRGFTVRRVHAHHNHGSGIWFDIDNHDAAILDCVSHHNGCGIHYEISYTAAIRGNRCYANQLQGQPVNSPAGQGIYISSSAGCVVEDNICFGNATRGIEVAGPVRDDGAGRQVASHSNTVRRNFIANNQAENPNATDFVLGYGSTLGNDVQPPQLQNSLLPVRPNRSDHNHFFRGDDRPFFWLPDGRRAATLAEWQAISGQDLHSTWTPPPPDAPFPLIDKHSAVGESAG